MNRALRLVAAGGIAAVALFALYRLIYLPYRCNYLRGPMAVASERIFKIDRGRGVPAARRHVEQMMPCVRLCETTMDYYMIAAANYRYIGDYDKAIELYQKALTYDRRPELYFNLGQTLLYAGRRDEARPMLLMAGYSGMYINKTDDPFMRQEMINAVSKWEANLRKKIPPRQ